MHSTPEARIELLRAERQPDGSHTSERLVELLRRGQLLRLRRGIYVPAQQWVEAPPWTRYEITIAGVAMSRAPLFCRETTLTLYGLPLLKTPRAVYARTSDPGSAKQLPPPGMTGKVPPQQFRRRYDAAHPDEAPLKPARLSSFPVKLVEAACPANTSRSELRGRIRDGTFRFPEVRLGAGSLHHVMGPSTGYRSEPLGLAVIDTVSRMSFAEAVVVLDAVKARNDVDVDSWLPYLRSQRQRARWYRAWEFADGRAESALESESRVVMDRLNCPAPTLQKVIRTPTGDFRTDFCWERERVVGEVDGKVKYFNQQYVNGMEPAELHYREKQRREALEGQGWRVLRWGKDALRDPRVLNARFRRAGLL
ncbi:hypothetical protein [Nesterenkonia haasae]|uniref:hypothetical protein n=1 Tax=Nesterenkonia haasae TaxID=2587813 RepID=UPI0013914C5F|nr:hypothetical protein [Nesterenkonia haasae]NDK32411.1 hypothetical protein [Nesterenkonia haasae]